LLVIPDEDATGGRDPESSEALALLLLDPGSRPASRNLAGMTRTEPTQAQHSHDHFRSPSKGAERAAIRTLPVNPATGKPPEVLLHAGVANLEAAGAGPAKRLLLSAATASI